jgi:hypothetical protein
MGNGLVMQPGGEYKFKGASYVEEIPFFQAGGKKIYVESENDPRYTAYQDSLKLYNHTSSRFKEPWASDKKFKKTVNSNKNSKEYKEALKKYYDEDVKKSNIKPTSIIFSDRKKDTYIPVFKKPQQQQVIVKPANTSWTPLTPEIAKGRYEGDLKNMFYRKNEKPSKYDIVYIEPPQVSRQPIKSIQNNLKPEGLIQSDIELSADMSGLRPVVRIPEYYDVEDIVNNGKSQTNYKWYPENNESLRQLSEESGDTRKLIPRYQTGGKSKINPSLERQLLSKYVDPVTKRAMERAKQKGIRTGIHNGGLDAIRHSSSAAATSSILPSWANALPGGLSANIAMTNLAGLAHEVNSPNSFKEHASDLYNNFVGSVVGTLPITEESKHDLLIEAQKNGILSDMGNKRPSNSRQTRPSNSKQNNMDNTTNSAFNRNIRGKKTFNQFLLGDTPEFRKGGQKSDWISDKISTLVREGYPQKQAVAIAYSMYENVHGNGGYQLPKYQLAGTAELDEYGQPLPKPQPNPTPIINNQASGQNTFAPGNVNSWDIDNNGVPDTIQKTEGNPLVESKSFDKNIFGEEGAKEKEKSDVAPLDVKGEQPFQFFNPYSGFDIPTAASTLGSSIESGDTLGIVGSGLKLATGLARNFLGGMGQERRKNYMTQQSYEKQREGMTGEGREKPLGRFGGYYQEGGMQPGMEEGMEQQGQEQQIMGEVAQMLQQGADPQQVIQQLVQMGIPEEQAVQMVEAVMQEIQGSTPQLKRGGMMYYKDGGEDEEDEEGYGYEYEEEPNYMINKPSLMGKQQNFTQRELATSPAIESAVEATSSTKEEETPSYDKNSARDTWVAKTGMPWSEAKRLGYTSGTAKDNMKLLSELNDPRFKKEYLRKSSPKGEKTYNGGQLKEVVVTRPKKNNYVDPYKGWYNDSEGDLRNAKGVMVGLDGKPLNFLERNFSSSITLPPLDDSGRRMPRLRANATAEEANAYHLAQYKNKIKRQKELEDVWGKIPSSTPFIKYQDGGDYDTYDEKSFKDNDMVRHSGGNTGLTKSEVNSLAKQYKMSPQEFLNIISYGKPGEGMSTKRELSLEGSDKYLPTNWREEYKKTKPSSTGFRGTLNRGLDYIGVEPMFYDGGYYQDGGEQQIAQQVAQAMQQGMQPQEAMAMLMESGMTEDQAIQLVQAIMEQVQQQGQQMEEGTPQMRRGGEMIKRKDGSYSRRGLWDNIRDNAGSGKEPTKEMLEQERKIKANKKEMGGYMYAEGGINNPGFKALPKEVQAKIMSNMYQEGGMEPEADPAQEMMQQVAQMLQQGAQPEEVLQMLVEAGIPEDQAIQLVQAVMQQMQAPQDTPQMRDGGGIPERYKNDGFTKVGVKRQSTRPGKKWMVLAKKGDQYKVVHGGDSKMKDFSQHGSEDRKKNFWNRMGGKDSAKANDPFSPLYWHKKFGTWQEGGEMMEDDMEEENEGMENESAMSEQIEDQVEQALKQGADPQQILQQLVQMGMPEEEAMQMIQEILQEMQGGEEEEEEGTPQMSKGGKYMRALVGKTIKNYTYNPKTDSYIVSYE